MESEDNAEEYLGREGDLPVFPRWVLEFFEFPQDDDLKIREIEEYLEEIEQEIRDQILFELRLDGDHIFDNWWEYVPAFNFFQTRIIQNDNEDYPLPHFTLTPFCKNTPPHILINKNNLYHLLNLSGRIINSIL